VTANTPFTLLTRAYNNSVAIDHSIVTANTQSAAIVTANTQSTDNCPSIVTYNTQLTRHCDIQYAIGKRL
jgi:hypothetical protein